MSYAQLGMGSGGGGVTIETVTGNDGMAIVPTSHNVNIIGNNTALNGYASYVTKTGTSTDTVNSFGPYKWVVNKTAGVGTHQTITAAMAAASAGDSIFVTAGTYTENFTIIPGVNLDGPGIGTTVVIGTITMSGAGTSAINNLVLQSNSSNIIVLSGSNDTAIYLTDCYLNVTSSTALSITSTGASSGLVMIDCVGAVQSGATLFAVSGGASSLTIFDCLMDQGNGSTVASTFAGNGFGCNNSIFDNPITISGSVSEFANVTINGENSIALTISTTAGTCSSIGGYYNGGTASAVSIGAGATFESINDLIGSNATNAVAGTGTFVVSNACFNGTSHQIASTLLTQVQFTNSQYTGSITGTTPASGLIGQVISSQILEGSPTTLSNGVTASLTSITLTPGNWMITGNGGVNNGTTTTYVNVGINTVNNALNANLPFLSLAGGASASFNNTQGGLGSTFVSISTNTQYFLNVNAGFTGTCTGYGIIQGVRLG